MPVEKKMPAVAWRLKADVSAGYRYPEQPHETLSIDCVDCKIGFRTSEQQFTSSITFGELIVGAHRLGPRSTVLLGQIETRLIPNLPILPFDAVAARRYGEVRALLEGQGTSLGDADLRIAAIALVRSLTIVTANTRHFRRVPGLPVES